MRRRNWFGWAIAVTGVMLLLPWGVFAQAEDAAPAEVPKEAFQGVPQDVSPEVPPGGFVHTVVKGDTLWDLSAKYLDSPWRWYEIWELNRFVTNPHYIYPGVKIVIVPSGPREAALIVDPLAESLTQQPAPASPGAQQRSGYLDISPEQSIRAGQFLKNKPAGIGRIEGGKEPKEAFSTGDSVYLLLDQKIPEGQLLAVYRVEERTNVPGGKVSSGYVKYLVGVLQVAATEDGRPIANVRDSFEDLNTADIISTEVPAFFRVRIAPGAENIRSTVIASQSGKAELHFGEFIFIDSGSDSGVEVGNVFRIHRALEFEAGAGIGRSQETRVETARAVVVRADKEFSTLVVSESKSSFDVGSQARRGIPAK